MRLLISFFILITPVYCADFTTFIGGSSLNQYLTIAALATDSAGDTYVTGSNAYVTKLDSSGNIVFNMSIGPVGSYATAIAVDPAGNVWVGGETGDTDFPVVNALQSSGAPNGVGFLVKMTPDGTVLYSSYFGGLLGNSGVTGIATDPGGNVYLTGYTDASDFPTTAGLPASPVTGGGLDPVFGLFVAKLNSTGQKILYSSVIAGPQNGGDCMGVSKTEGFGIAIDGAGNTLVAGATYCSDLPVITGGNSGPGPFVFKIDAAGNQLAYFTYLGAGASIGNLDSPTTAPASPIAVDASGNAYVAGYAEGPDFVTTAGAYQNTYTAGNNPEAFAMKLSPSGAKVWATFLGAGTNGSMANAISLDSSDDVWLTGTNGPSSAPGGSFVDELSADGSALLTSDQYPSAGAGQTIAVDQNGVFHVAGSAGLVSTLTAGTVYRVLSILNAASGTFIGQVAPGEVISIYGLGMGPLTPLTATPMNGLFPTSLNDVQVFVNGTPIPLLYASATQINAEIPSPVPGVANNDTGNGIADIQVVYTVLEWDPVQQIYVAEPLPDFRVAVVNSDFAVFQKPGPSMAVINQDGTVNKIANPAKAGSTVSIWATGFGATGPPADGAVATAANNYCSTCQVDLRYVSTDVFETVEYAGTSPGLIDGLMQINIMIPAQWSTDGAFVYFTPPGYTQALLLGWINISQ